MARVAPLDYDFITDVDSLPEGIFSTSTLGPSLLYGKRFFSIMKKALPQASIYYVAIYSGGNIIALVCVTESEIRLGPLKLKMAVCGNPLVSTDSGIFTLTGINRNAALPSILRVLNEAMDKRRVHMTLLKEIVAPETEMQSSGYYKIPLEPVLGLEVRGWNTFEEYTSAMKADYRGKIKKAQRELNQLGVSVVEEHDIRPIIDRIYELFKVVAYEPLRENHTNDVSPVDRFATWLTNSPRRYFRMVDKEFFISLKEEFTSETDIITLRAGSEIIGCTINLQDHDVFHSIYLGMERGKYTPYVYRTLLAMKVKHGIQRGVRLMHFGRTCLPTKSDLGSIELPEACYGRVRVGLINSLLALVAYELRSSQFKFVPRNVFKEFIDLPRAA